MDDAREGAPPLPGITGTARMGRTDDVLARLGPDDIAVLDHSDLDRETASALVATGVRLVVNAAPFVSGRVPASGPEVLAEAGVVLVDGVGAEALDLIADGQRIRVVDGVVHDAPGEDDVDDDGEVLATGRVLDLATVLRELADSRAGLVTELGDLMARTSHDTLPAPARLASVPRIDAELRTELGGRPVVVVARAVPGELNALREFVRGQAPALIASAEAADDLLALGWVPDVLVLSAGEEPPSADVLGAVRDVVVVGETPDDAGDVAGTDAPPIRVATSLTGEDVALLLTERAGATLVVGVGLRVVLEEFLARSEGDEDGVRSDAALAIRLAVGSRLVTAPAVRTLHSAGPRPLHVALVALAGTAALVAALSVTQVGQGWIDGLGEAFRGLL